MFDYDDCLVGSDCSSIDCDPMWAGIADAHVTKEQMDKYDEDSFNHGVAWEYKRMEESAKLRVNYAIEYRLKGYPEEEEALRKLEGFMKDKNIDVEVTADVPITVGGLQTNSSIFGRTVTQRCHWKDFETELPIKDLPVGTKFYAVYKKNGKAFVRSGAGIVADSVPEKEYQECVNKAAAIVDALNHCNL